MAKIIRYNKKEQVMKDALPVIRNTAFGLMILCSFMVFAVPVKLFDVPCMIMGAFGLAVALTTFWVEESKVQKVFFIMAGGGAAAVLIAFGAFHLLAMCGHKPGGDGGGITVPTVLIGLALTIVGSIGAIVCLIKRAITDTKNTPSGVGQ